MLLTDNVETSGQGVQVFHRINNQLHFTSEGKEFLNAGKEILAQLTTLESRLVQLGKDQLKNYIHGYSEEETRRLNDQATSIAELLHWDSRWPAGSLVLEAGCGVGAQTRIISEQNPDVRFMSVDLSEESLSKAATTIEALKLQNVELKLADVFHLPFEDNHFDHVFVCFLLEHLADPDGALYELKRVLKPGGTITIIEGDHGSTYFYPDSAHAQKAIQAQVMLQKLSGGNANIGRALYPMLTKCGFSNVIANPRVIYVDDSKPSMVEGFTRNTFTAMIKGVADEVISKNIIGRNEFELGISDLLKTAEGGGSFSYTFFKVTGTKP